MTLHRTPLLMIVCCGLGMVPTSFAGEGIVAVHDAGGRKIYVNDISSPQPASASSRNARQSPWQQPRLMYWSNTQHRWKAVPRATARAARWAAQEVISQTQPGGDGAGESAGAGSGESYAASTLVASEKVNAAIEAAAARHNVDANLVRAVIKVESNFNPRAVSRKGAMGLMQLMPGTARQLNLAHPFDPGENVDAGVRHLRQLLDNFRGDVRLSLAAYNAGTNAVVRSNGIPPNRETRNYVKQITALYGNGFNLMGGPSHAPIRVGRDGEGHFVFSNTD